MPDYIFNNTVLTQDDIEEIASIKGYTLDELFEKNPDIKQIDPDEEGKETPSQETESAAVEESAALEPTVTESVLEDTFLDSQKIKIPEVKTGTVADTDVIDPKAEIYKLNPEKYFNDFAESIKIEGAAGYSRGETITSAMELFNTGKDASPEQINAYIQDNLNIAEKTMQSSIMKDWQETYDKLGGGVLGWVVATAAEPRVLPAMAVQSTALQIASLKDETVRRNAAAAAAGGATLGLATTGGVTSLPNAIIGAFSASMGTMETALTFAELLNEATNNNLTKENIKSVLEDSEKLADIQKKAIGRGIAITAVEGITGGLAKGVGSKMFKRGASPLSTSVAMAGAGAVGGSLGEIAGMKAAGQELEASEILFEGFTPGPASIFAGQNIVKNVKTLVNEGEINNIIKPTEYTNISYAFDPIEKTTETQINIAQIPGSEEILDRNIRKEINKGNITKEQGDAIKLNFRETQGTVNQIKSLRLNEQDQAITVQLMKEKKQLKNQIEQVGEPNLTTEQSDRIKQIDEDLKGISSKAVTQQVEKVREAAKDITDLDIQEFATTAETEAFLNKQDQDVKASSQQGFIIQNKDGKQTIVINREVADKEIAVAAPAHEFLHAILYKTVKDSPNTALQLGNSLMEYIGKIDINQVKDSNFAQRLQQYQDQPAEVQAEEALTLFSDAILTGDIKFKENIFTKLRDVISKILQVGGVKARFDTGRDVYNFIRDYNKNIQEGKLTSQQIRTAEEGVKLDIQDQAVKQAETVIKESKSEEASNKVQEIYEQKGINGALDIIEQFKPITNKIVDQRKNAPGFDRQLLTDEIETGTGGILDLIQAYDPASNVPLAAYINKYLPVRSITASRRILGEEFTDDITESVQVAAETAPEVEIEVAETKPTERLIEVKKQILSEPNQKELEDIVAEKLPELTPDQFTFKTLPNWAKQTLAKEIDIPVKKFEGSSNFTQAELDRVTSFIENNIDTVRKALPDAAVLEGAPVSESLMGTATGVPNNLLKDTNLYTRLERGTKKAGLVPFQKNKGIDNTSIFKAIGIVDGKRTAGPRDKQAQTAKGLINVLAKFMTNQEIRKQADLTPQQKTDIETGKGSRLLYSLNTKGDGTWVQNPLNPLDNKSKIYSFKVGDLNYDIKTFQQSFKDNAYDFELFDGNELEEEFIKDIADDNNSLSLVFAEKATNATQTTGAALEGLTNQFKVFGIVANSTIDLIKKEKLNSITFSGRGESRKRLYEAMVQKFKKELGWESYNYELEDGESEAYIVYDPKVFINPETGVTTDVNPATIKYSYNINDKDWPQKKKEIIKQSNIAQEYYGNVTKTGGSLRPSHFISISTFFTNKNNKDKTQVEVKEIREKLIKYKTKNKKSLLKPGESYKTPQKIYGNSKDSILKNIENGSVFENSKIYTRIFDDFWVTTHKMLQEKPEMYDFTENMLKNSNNDVSHPTRLGAVFSGFDPNAKYNPKGFIDNNGNFVTPGTYEYEHAVQSHIVWKKLLNSAKNIKDPNIFKLKLEEIKKNYILVALSKKDNAKVTKAGYAHKMPVGWENWWERYFNLKVNKFGGINPKSLIAIEYNKEKATAQLTFTEAFGIKNAKGELTEFGKNQIKIKESKSKAAVKNNLELPKSQRLPKDSTNEQVLAKMQELDNEANEARIKYSKSQNLDDAFNDIIEAKTGIETYKRFSPAKAQVRGASKGKFNFFIPPSAEDFVGLLYKTLAKGKLGDNQMQWYKDNLLDPYARAMNDISSARVAMFNDYKQLKEDLKVIPKDLKKKSVDEYTKEQAVRVYIWNKQGNNIPGLFKTDQKELSDYVNKDPELKLFAEQLIAIQKGDVYAAPKEGWLAGSITTDFLEGLNTTKRKKYLEQWQTNVDEIFSEVNLNKLEAAFGKPYRNALENILRRMKTGRNKPFESDSLAGRFTNWLNNSVGAIMFFNTRSAVLQLLSSINFVNFSDNNPLMAGVAFANQPQYWKDFKFLFNSDFLKERRGGLRFNVSESEIADMAKKAGARGVLSRILQAGFLPTQAADSFAIASGGATFYRNRINTYIKQGLTESEAQDKAFTDFRELAEESQQSSRPDRISAQQAGPLGRTILAFANTPAQYARLTKKAASDLINGRGDAKTNITKLAYYGFVQNLMFTYLQQAVFAIAFGDSEEDEKEKEKKYLDVANSMADGFLRGIGISGAIISTVKNALIKIVKESEKKRPDYAETTVMQLLGISPPVQSKAQKIRSALKSYEWNKKEMLEKGFSLDNPAYLAGANVISASTNLPLDRIVKKVDNIKNSTRDDITSLNRVMLLAGWSDWQLGIQEPKKEVEKKVARGSKRGTSRSSNRPSNRR